VTIFIHSRSERIKMPSPPRRLSVSAVAARREAGAAGIPAIRLVAWRQHSGEGR